jgi:hypothetical protein
MASPVGIEIVSGGSTHLASEQHLALTTGGHVGMAVGRGWFASVAQGARIFVHRLGMKLVAASGKIRMHKCRTTPGGRGKTTCFFCETVAGGYWDLEAVLAKRPAAAVRAKRAMSS